MERPLGFQRICILSRLKLFGSALDNFQELLRRLGVYLALNGATYVELGISLVTEFPIK